MKLNNNKISALEKGQVVRLKHKSLGHVDGSQIEKLMRQASISSWDELSKMREDVSKVDDNIKSPQRDKLFKHLDASLSGIGKKMQKREG